MLITIGQGDFGKQIPIGLWPMDNYGFSYDELNSADFNCIIFRIDRLKVQMELADSKLIPSDKRRIHYYQNSDNIVVFDETMSIAGLPDIKGEYVAVTRAAKTNIHKKGEPIFHTIYESITMVTWDSQLRRVFLTPEVDCVKYVGSYRLQIEVDIPGVRKAICQESSKGNRFLLQVKRNAQGI